MTRIRHLSVVVLALWIGLPAQAQDETEYLAVFLQGKKVGHALETRRVEGDKVITSEDVSITISRMGFPLTVKTNDTSVETTDGKPLSFESEQLLGFVTMKVSGTVDANGLVEMTSTSMGAERKSTMPWPEGAIMAEGLRLLTLEKGLKADTAYTTSIFMPSLTQVFDANIVIGDKRNVDLLGRVVKLTEVTTTLKGPALGQVTSTSYVDDDMKMLKSVAPLMGMEFEMISCAKEFALGDEDVVELIGAMFVDSPTRLNNLSSAASITYWLAPNAGAEFTLPTTDSQTVEHLADGRIKLVIRPVAASAGGTFPYEGNDPGLLAALKPTRFLQSDSEEIVALARKAVGDTQDAAEAARRIEAFVAEYIENKSLSVGYASAAEVASSRQGDCSEFAVLTAALCRAVGIPSQVVAGVAYVSDFGGHEGFGGHAWTQAYIDGKWVGLDAAFKSSGRGGYDAGHIALAVGNGEPADFLNIASTLGHFRIEDMAVQTAR
ncbi:MAG: transglutaminase domain-containing protein [Sedimentisphaerales bacterium]|nr:transglutaminase domain-containing protein [Sedimentisphaerales bacterium]